MNSLPIASDPGNTAAALILNPGKGRADFVRRAAPTPKPDCVRLAGPQDEQRIFELLQKLHGENAMFQMSPARVMERIKLATECKGGLIGLLEIDGKLAGSVGLFMSQFWYTEIWHLEELWNFVHPDYRKNPQGKHLLEFMKWANENLGIMLSTGIMSTIRLEGKMKLYMRKFFLLGAFFMNPPLEAGG